MFEKNIVKYRPPFILLYGEHKVGKSTICSQFPEPAFLDLEDNINHVEGVLRKRIVSYPEYMTAINEIKKTYKKDKLPFKTLIIDSATVLEKLVEEYIVGSKEKGIGSIPHGAGYGRLWNMYHHALLKLKTDLIPLGIIVVVIAHKAFRAEEDSTVRPTIRAISDRNRDAVNQANFDQVLYMTLDKSGRRVFITQQTTDYYAGGIFNNIPAKMSADVKNLLGFIKDYYKAYNITT